MLILNMAKKTLLTTENIIETLKKAGFPTKKDVEDIVHNQLTEFHTYMTMPEIEKLRTEMKEGFSDVNIRLKQVENNVAGVKRDIHYMRDDIQNIEYELSITKKRKVIIA